MVEKLTGDWEPEWAANWVPVTTGTLPHFADIPRPPPVPWSYVVAATDGTPLGELTLARSRTVTWRRDAPGEAHCAVPVRTDQARLIAEYATDLLVHRDGLLVFRGRIGRCPVARSADEATIVVNAVDYRGFIHRRDLFADFSRTNTDQSQIAWDLINYTQTLTGGNLGITRGTGQTTGVNRTRNYERGKTIGEAIDQLGQVINGFEWDIDPSLAFNVWYPMRGQSRGVLDYGGQVASYTRNPRGEFANAVQGFGDQDEDDDGDPRTTPVSRTSTDLATRPEGRLDLSFAESDIREQATLQARVEWMLARSETLRHAYYLTLTTGRWSPDILEPGDSFLFPDVDLNEVRELRVEELGVVVGDDGGETVTVHGEPSEAFG